jgi:hypothetical protein
MIRYRNAGQKHNINIGNKSFEGVEQFKYLGTALTYQNSLQKEIKNKLKSENACCHSVQNIVSSSLLSKNMKIKIKRTLILPVVVYGCKTWCLH